MDLKNINDIFYYKDSVLFLIDIRALTYVNSTVK